MHAAPRETRAEDAIATQSMQSVRSAPFAMSRQCQLCHFGEKSPAGGASSALRGGPLLGALLTITQALLSSQWWKFPEWRKVV